MNTQDTQHILDEIKEFEQFSSDEAYATLQGKMHQTKKRKSRRRIYILSTSITSAAAVVMLLFWLQFNTIEILNESNSPLTHVLPDGSTVEMNKYAELNYRRDFKNGRKLKLSGEAFFDIVPNATRPFIIKAGKSQVKVVGTSFNVRHHVNSDAVEVYVKTGTVLLSNDDSYALELSASQLGIATSDLREIPQTNLNYMAWKDHKLVFSNSDLPYVIATIEDTYHINVDLIEDSLSQLSLSTTFHQLSLDEIMTSLCLTLNLKFEKSNEGYILSRE